MCTPGLIPFAVDRSADDDVAAAHTLHVPYGRLQRGEEVHPALAWPVLKPGPQGPRLDRLLATTPNE
ncbi:hypothetical protein PgNI_06122 [Pyricularia grisea]|uniref:Uncharacterized protein n=1 Tax=Pyricularia grisea TaxID=148305 RepID=A0A6P8B5Q7_PYRGI|nr:hypothetical protein PgNI_06122 [Pyricularia grisea]TLD10585.1 hypothetical protein PgNI_06122 [Pyricularia grisea]